MATDLAPANKKPTLLQVVSGDNFKNQLKLALPKHVTPDRFARIALTCIRKNPALLKCTQESVLSCLITLSQYGLELDGYSAYLIPFKDECTLIVSYRGLAQLALRSGLVSTIHADVVRRGDIFDYSMGVMTNHVPWFLRTDDKKPAAQGDVFAIYALVKNKDGTSSSVVLSKDEVEAVRRRSRSGNSGPWQTDWNEMAKKTAFRRLAKWLVLSPEFRDAVAHDEEVDILETTATTTRASKIDDLIEDHSEPEQDREPGDDQTHQEQP